MVNKPKNIGTAYETACRKYLTQYYPDIKRVALSGTTDKGDLYTQDENIIFECKAYKKLSPKLFDKWMKELRTELTNANAQDAYLLVKLFGRSIEDSLVYNIYGNCIGTLETAFDDDYAGDHIDTISGIINLLAFGKER